MARVYGASFEGVCSREDRGIDDRRLVQYFRWCTCAAKGRGVEARSLSLLGLSVERRALPILTPDRF